MRCVPSFHFPPYLANAPAFPEDREYTERQLYQHEELTDAVAYEKGAIKLENLLHCTKRSLRALSSPASTPP